MPYACERCPEARPSVYYCAEAGCLGPLASNSASVEQVVLVPREDHDPPRARRDDYSILRRV